MINLILTSLCQRDTPATGQPQTTPCVVGYPRQDHPDQGRGYHAPATKKSLSKSSECESGVVPIPSREAPAQGDLLGWIVRRDADLCYGPRLWPSAIPLWGR